MSGTAPSSQTSEDETQQEEQEYKDISEQDIHQLGFSTQIFGAVMLVKTKRYQTFKNAYNTLTDPKLAENLLDFTHPENVAAARTALNITEKELKKKGNTKRGYTESRFFFGKSRQITPDQYKRALYATTVSQRLHNKINKRTTDIKLELHMKRFGVPASEVEKVKKSLFEWMRKNPGKNIDDAILSATRQKYEEQKKKLDKKEEEVLKKELSGAKKQAADEHKETIDRGARVTKDILDPNQPQLTLHQLHEKIDFVEKGVSPTQQLSPIQVKPVVSAPSSIPKPPSLPPQLHIPKISFSLPKISLPKFSFPSGFGNMFGGLGKIGGMFNKLGGFGSGIKSGLGQLGKTALTKLGLGAATGGVATALSLAFDAIRALTGIDIEGLVLKAALFAVAVPVVILLLFIFGLSNSNIIPSYSSRDAISVASSQNTTLGWKDFEEKFITNVYSPQTASWSQFATENLILPKTYISLEQK